MICDPKFSRELWQRARKIKLILMDVDGVLANGNIIYDTEFREIKMYDSQDGLGINLARTAGLKTGIISARNSESIRHRAEELKMDYLFLGHFFKIDAYKKFKKDTRFRDEEICFVGDDLTDIPVLEKVGLPVAVQNAIPDVKVSARFYTVRPGGKGAIREIIEFILFAQGRLEAVKKQMLTHQ